MERSREIVVTGAGVVSPIGIGVEPFWAALAAGESGVRPITRFDASHLPVRFGGQIEDFDPRQFVRPRKSLKVMTREMQFAFAAADLAVADAGLQAGGVDPMRFGVAFGGDMIYADIEDLEAAYRQVNAGGEFEFSRWAEAMLAEVHPLWLLKHLPNMAASHIAIAHDARGPNNTIVLGEVSSLLAVAEAASVIGRGWADVMLAGGTGCQLHPTALVGRGDQMLSHRSDDCRRASRPFDRERDGFVNGEGAGVIVLESRAHAERRGARIRGRILGAASRCEPRRGRPPRGTAIANALEAARSAAGFAAADIGHVNAHGLGSVELDRIEATAIRAVFGDVPVTAVKGAMGYLGAGGGVVELVASLLAFDRAVVPPTRNYEQPDPACPVNVVHGDPLGDRSPTAVKLSLASTGQAVAVALAGHQEP